MHNAQRDNAKRVNAFTIWNKLYKDLECQPGMKLQLHMKRENLHTTASCCQRGTLGSEGLLAKSPTRPKFGDRIPRHQQHVVTHMKQKLENLRGNRDGANWGAPTLLCQWLLNSSTWPLLITRLWLPSNGRKAGSHLGQWTHWMHRVRVAIVSKCD